MLYIAIVLGVCLVAVIYKNWVGRAGEQYLVSLVHQKDAVIDSQDELIGKYHTEIQALYSGRDEQEENYEMQFLSFREEIAGLKGDLEEAHQQIEDLTEMCKDQQIDLDMHDTKCLPDIETMRWMALTQSFVQNA